MTQSALADSTLAGCAALRLGLQTLLRSRLVKSGSLLISCYRLQKQLETTSETTKGLLAPFWRREESEPRFQDISRYFLMVCK